MLNGSNALLVTSFHEGSPNIVKEAMACNLPIISVPCGDVSERLKGVSNSWVVSYDAKDLSEKLIEGIMQKFSSYGYEIFHQQGLTNESLIQQIATKHQQICLKKWEL